MTKEEIESAPKSGKECPDCRTETLQLAEDKELCEQCGMTWTVLVSVYMDGPLASSGTGTSTSRRE